MAGYLIVDSEITDQSLFEEFASGMKNLIEAQGGRYLVRGGATELVEGDRTPHRVVVVEFESMEQARTLVNSSEYVEIAALRSKSSVSTTFIVEGV